MGGSCFLVLRHNSFHTLQVCFFKDKERPEHSAKIIKYLKCGRGRAELFCARNGASPSSRARGFKGRRRAHAAQSAREGGEVRLGICEYEHGRGLSLNARHTRNTHS